jgi:hypothetical protein
MKNKKDKMSTSLEASALAEQVKGIVSGGKIAPLTLIKAIKILKPSAIEKKAKGGLMEATARLKAKGMKEGGMVVKDKIVSIDKSPNSGLITTKGFGAGRRT